MNDNKIMNHKIILCFIDNNQEDYSLNEYLQHLDSLGCEIHLYQQFSYQSLQPHHVLYELEALQKDSKCEYLFLTNLKNLFYLVYRLYHQLFDQFIYYQGIEEIPYDPQEIYIKLFSSKIKKEENLYKPVYTNTLEKLFSDIDNVRSINDLMDRQDDLNEDKKYTLKYFLVDGRYYLFEPVKGTDKLYVVDMPNDNQNYSNTEYEYFYRSDLFDQLIYKLENDYLELKNDYTIVFQAFQNLLNKEMPFQRQMLICILSDWCDSKDNVENPYSLILLLSFLAHYTGESYYFERILTIVLHNDSITAEEKYFIYQQVKTNTFMKPSFASAGVAKLQADIYKKVYKLFETKFHDRLIPISKNERNQDLVVIFAYQFLSENHPPTHTSLERAYNIANELNKRVVIINTHENATTYGEIPFYNTRYGNFITEYNNLTEVTYKDYRIPFHQIEDPMPSYEAIDEIITFIANAKPYFILNIGGSSITADLCGNIVPELSMSVVFSSLPRTVGKLSILGRKVRETEWENLYKSGYEKDSIIESTFTFELKPQKVNLSRTDLSLPQDKFLMIVVGNRLNEDITDEYIDNISETFQYGTHLVIAGEYPNYESICERYPLFKEHTTYLGYVSDIVAVMDNIDLYVNPRRMGGGFSITEAFFKEKPGVTINFGDVAVAAGEDFCVKDYKELVEEVKRYCSDKDYYLRMSKKAGERAKVLTDSAKALRDIVEKAERSKYFF